jgi:hypothetical protein
MIRPPLLRGDGHATRRESNQKTFELRKFACGPAQHDLSHQPVSGVWLMWITKVVRASGRMGEVGNQLHNNLL